MADEQADPIEKIQPVEPMFGRRRIERPRRDAVQRQASYKRTRSAVTTVAIGALGLVLSVLVGRHKRR